MKSFYLTKKATSCLRLKHAYVKCPLEPLPCVRLTAWPCGNEKGKLTDKE